MPKKYKTMKVFDCQDMPKDLWNQFKDQYGAEIGQHNDSIIEYEIHGEVFSKKDQNSDWAKMKNDLDVWLIANGAEAPKTDDDAGEEVLIKYWW